MKSHPLERISTEYLSEKNISPSTNKSYKIAFKHYIDYLKKNDILFAKTSDVFRYREQKRALGKSSAYIHIHISALKGLYRYLRQHQKRLGLNEHYAHDIMTPIKSEPVRHQITKPILTIEQAKHLLMHTKNNRKYIWHYRDYSIVCLMLMSGIRRFEIRHAKRSDYQVKEGQRVLLIQGNDQTPSDQFVKLSNGAKEALDEYLDRRLDNNPYLFATTKNTSPKQCLSRTFFRYMFRRVLKECGLDDLQITPNCLRHTAGVMNLLRGASIERTQKLLRHQSIQSTLVYADYVQRLQDDSEYQIDQFILGEEKSIYEKKNHPIDWDELFD